MSPIHVQYAVACLDRLLRDDRPTISLESLAKENGIPMNDCRDVIEHLEAAGIISEVEGGVLEVSRPDATALDILNALWSTPVVPAFKALFGRQKGAQVLTQQWAHSEWAQG